MRVLQLIGSTGFYGAEAVVSSLAENLPRLGVDCVVGHLRRSGPRAPFLLEEHIHNCEVIPMEHDGRLDIGFLRRLRKTMNLLDVDIVHSHGYKPDFYGGLVAQFGQIPMVSTCHLWTKSTRALRAYAKLDSLLLRAFDRVVAVSPQIFEELARSGIRKSQLLLIPNGVTSDRFSGGQPTYRAHFEEDTFIFGMACRQVGAKGVDLAIRAMPAVCAVAPHARLLIAGDGPKLEEYQALADRSSVARNIVFVGRCNDTPDFYHSLDAFLLPSLDEGMPIAMLEAMASGRAVIASTVGSVSQVLRDGISGLLIPPGDLAALTSTMLTFCSHPEKPLEMGRLAQSDVNKNHSGLEMTRNYSNLYKEVTQ